MTADQSLSPANSHTFPPRRHHDPLMGSDDSSLNAEPPGTQRQDEPHSDYSSQDREPSVQNLYKISPVSPSTGQPSIFLQGLEQQLLDALRHRMASGINLSSLLIETVAHLQKDLVVDRVLMLPMGDRPPTNPALLFPSIPPQPHQANQTQNQTSDSIPLPSLVSGPIESRVMDVPSIQDYSQHSKSPQGENPIWIVTDSDRRAYAQGQVDVIGDIASTTLFLPQRTWLDALKVKSYINLPIVIHQQLWGLLVIQSCEDYRAWSSAEVNTLKRVVQEIAIAVEQAELRQLFSHRGQNLHKQTMMTPSALGQRTSGQQSSGQQSSGQQSSGQQSSGQQSSGQQSSGQQSSGQQSSGQQSSGQQSLGNHSRDFQADALPNEGMGSFKQSLKFAELVLEVTERIRDSLDESQILQTATQELAKALNIERCKIELYDPSLATATVAYEHAVIPPNCIGMTREIADFPELYKPLFQHQPIQFVVPVSSNLRLVNMTRLACPIFDDQGILGNLWLFRPRNEMFNRWEVRIIQQIANECAIAIRQARLYEASQQQVRELERLSQLKDDFLKTISHELRTPLSSIILGIQTLERVLDQGHEEKDQPTIERLFQTVHMECHRENKLIEDLLTFCYLEAGKEASMVTSIDLNRWVLDIIKPFEIRIQNQQQQLTVDLCDRLPPLTTELAYLERIVSELLNNACKYTPVHEHIVISTTWKCIGEDTDPSFDAGEPRLEGTDYIVLAVQNSGIEIPEEEQERIFDKFYRIPTSDPWQYGGTGLGLALVKKLTECLGASIHVTSLDGQTKFWVLFPVNR